MATADAGLPMPLVAWHAPTAEGQPGPAEEPPEEMWGCPG